MLHFMKLLMCAWFLLKNGNLVGFNLLSRGTYHVSGTGLNVGYALVNKTDMVPQSMKCTI